MKKHALLLLLASCGPMELPLEQADLVQGPERGSEAVSAICDAFRCPSPPPVYWNGPAALNCADGEGFVVDGRCVRGVTGSNGVLIAYPAGDIPPSSTALTHEIAHWTWEDFDHGSRGVGRIWGAPDPDSDWEPGTRVGDMNMWLESQGL